MEFASALRPNLLGGVRGELQFGEARVQAAASDQALMRALLGEPAAVEHQDAVGVDHGRQPMGDDERGAALHDFVERALHQSLAFGIERAGRLVEQ